MAGRTETVELDVQVVEELIRLARRGPMQVAGDLLSGKGPDESPEIAYAELQVARARHRQAARVAEGRD